MIVSGYRVEDQRCRHDNLITECGCQECEEEYQELALEIEAENRCDEYIEEYEDDGTSNSPLDNEELAW